MHNDSSAQYGSECAAFQRRSLRAQASLAAALALCFVTLVMPVAGQTGSPDSKPVPAEAPQAQPPVQSKLPTPGPCQLKRTGTAVLEAGAIGAVSSDSAKPVDEASLQLPPCPPLEPLINWYDRFVNGPQVKPLTPREKGWLAVRNVADPFNAITILGSSAIAVGSDAHSPYGPGMPGFGRSVGVSYAQDLTGEFFGTFLIPAIAHQDPHYHRMPGASLKRRIAHAIYQVAWTQGDNGKPMVNYADLVGFAIDDEIGNLYVPNRQTNLPASAERYAIGLATAPIDNFVTEFLPDVARRIHIRVVLIQRIINQVAKTESPSTQ